jgi:DNA-3-methyladenine glycosylase
VILAPDFYNRPTLAVARDLLGKVLVHDAADGLTAGVIVEVEAYIGEDDPACHAARGLTARNAPLYGPPGLAYVYFNYGMHWLVNAVTEGEGRPAAVLLRALAPLDGVDLMRQRRLAQRASSAPVTDNDLCRGPGNLTTALGITGAQNRADLHGGALRIEDRGLPAPDVAWSARVGIRVGLDRDWRAYVPAHPAVSGRSRGP